MRQLTKSVLTASVLAVMTTVGSYAQGLFDPVARVDDTIITEFEVQQRLRFLQLLNAPGATRDGVLETLIEDRLRRQAAAQVGLRVTDEGLIEAMDNFAAQGDLSGEEFVALLEQNGIAGETFRDFITVNIEWRDLIRARYGSRVQISEAEVDRALAASSNEANIRVLLSEIIIPAPPPRAAQAQAQAEEASQATSIAEFSRYARQYSATATRGAGGRLPWTPLTNLPPQLRSTILGLNIGEVTEPIPLQNAIALFQLRDIEETGTSAAEYAAIEYAAYYIDGGRSDAALARARALAEEVDVCDDLYGVAQGQPEEVLERGSLAPSDIPQDIAIELAKLDPGEVSYALTRAEGQTLVFLMMCGRTAVLEEEVDREDVTLSLRNRRLEGFADSLLEELRASTDITILE
ncbi:MAG: SurA N-terminal domain-containing protein [Rhodobacteraceae bacterium]|nr:SurA N-terminal domain-containing protein [Paracoccaceae bacterium]